MDLSGNATDKRVFGLIAGRAGSGKTTQITTFPKDQTVAISVEDGFLSIQGCGISAIKVETYEDVLEVLKGLSNWPHKYVVFDSLSEIYDMILREARDKFTSAQNFQKHDFVKDRMFHVIREARKIVSKDIFFICHTKEEKSGMVLEQEISFDGKLPSDIKKQFDLVVHLDTIAGKDGRSERVIITDSSVSKVAKARVSPFMGISVLPIEEPNLYKLVQKLKGELK